MTNRSPWKDPPFLSSVNHLFQWAIYTMAMLNNQRVIYMYIPKTVVYFPKVPNPFFFHLKGVGIIYIYTHSVIVYIIYEIQTYNYIIYYFWSWVVLSNPNRGSLKKLDPCLEKASQIHLSSCVALPAIVSLFADPWKKMQFWLVVSTPLKNISQMGLLFPIYGKYKMFQTTNQNL